MFPYRAKYIEFESDIQNNELLYKIHQICQTSFDILKNGKFWKGTLLYYSYKLHNLYFVSFVFSYIAGCCEAQFCFIQFWFRESSRTRKAKRGKKASQSPRSHAQMWHESWREMRLQIVVSAFLVCVKWNRRIQLNHRVELNFITLLFWIYYSVF